LESISVNNNLTGKKELIKPLLAGRISMYACGVTVYDHCHIGHAMQAIFFDVIRRYMQFGGYQVTYVRNYTDVDDKIINRAAERSMGPEQLAQEMIHSSETDMKALGVEPPDHAPRVSEMIPQIISMISDLIANEAAYATADGDVFYRVMSKKDYGKLSNVKVDQLRGGTRDLAGGQKEDELDFALWKADNTLGASWESPWGLGRPGWHIECSAMSKALLGASFDIHGGGRDLLFPHHENEVAQSESANKCGFANYWIHCGLLTINKQKMSKSLGNHIMISEFLKSWPPEVLRLAILEHHYSSNIDFSDAVFSHCLFRLIYYYKTLAGLEKRLQQSLDSIEAPSQIDRGRLNAAVTESFTTAMNDDFNSAAALGSLNKAFRQLNELLKTKKLNDNQRVQILTLGNTIRQLASITGLLTEDPTDFLETLKDRALTALGIERQWVESQIVARRQARGDKNFALADQIRDQLVSKGIELMDSTDGTDWSVLIQESEQI
jgi:cysteinyl-tRNA synthetase